MVGAGNISYTFNRYVTLGGGITSLPSVRSTEGQFPYWLGVDDRLIADEFFRGSYTTGFWLKGEIATKVKYMAMLANNLSTLGVSASQIDNTLNTTSFMLQWLPTTGEFGLYGTFGDYDQHEKLATRLAVHYTHSPEDKQSQPGTNGIENSQIRLTDGSVIFTPDLFGPGITVEKVDYDMASVDGGLKYKGFSLEAEYYWRWLSDFGGTNTEGIADIDDTASRCRPRRWSCRRRCRSTWAARGSTAPLRRRLGGARGRELVLVKERGLRFNAEWIHLNKCPVGLHGRSLSRGRQRRRLPRELRDELLRVETAMDTQAPTGTAPVRALRAARTRWSPASWPRSPRRPLCARRPRRRPPATSSTTPTSTSPTTSSRAPTSATS